MSQFGLSNRFQTFEKNADLTKARLKRNNNYLFECLNLLSKRVGRISDKKSCFSILGPLASRTIEKHLQ